MGDGVTNSAPVNQAHYSRASCSADSSQSEFAKALSQEQQSSGAGQPVCKDSTAPTPREQALQQSLPENERHLPPSLWQMAQGGRTLTVGHQPGGVPNNPHLSENVRFAGSKSQASAQKSGGLELCNPFSLECLSSTASIVTDGVKGLAKDAVKGSRVITEGISRGTTAAGDWVSDQANDLASGLDESGHPLLASAARGGGVLAATATKTVGEVVGQAVALGPNMVVGVDSAGTNIGVGAARIKLATNSEERWAGMAQVSAGIGEAALVGLSVLGLAEGAAIRPRPNTVPGMTRKQINQANREQFTRFEGQVTQDSKSVLTKTATQVRVHPFTEPVIPGRPLPPTAPYVVIDTVKQSRVTGGNHLIDAKSSPTAPLQPNQIPGYPLIEQFGGVVSGAKGGTVLPAGTIVPPTQVQIVRPADLIAKKALQVEAAILTDSVAAPPSKETSAPQDRPPHP